MNIRIALFVLLLPLAGLTQLFAQPPPIREQHPPPLGPPPTIEKFFDIIRQRNPEEYERLRSLRETDPEAFLDEIESRIEQERIRRGLGAPPGQGPGPRMAPRRDREFRRLRPGDEGDAMSVHSPEVEAHEQKAREIAASLRTAKTDEERAARIQELRDELARAFDLREQLRRDRIKQMRERLDKLEAFLATRQSNRDAILDRRVNELIGEDPTSW